MNVGVLLRGSGRGEGKTTLTKYEVTMQHLIAHDDRNYPTASFPSLSQTFNFFRSYKLIIL